MYATNVFKNILLKGILMWQGAGYVPISSAFNIVVVILYKANLSESDPPLLNEGTWNTP